MSQDYIDAAIASFAASWRSEQDARAPEEKIRVHAETVANQKLENANLVKRKVEAGVRIINDRAAGHNIPRLSLCGIGYPGEAGLPIPNQYQIQFCNDEGHPLRYQPLGTLSFKFDVQEDVEASTIGAGPHDPGTKYPDFIFGTYHTASLTKEWVADMIARWLSRENEK
ncbi:hypothetical protein C8J46_1164 [Sphingomonas sp. PP-F2F-A104-K0414]|uniref:hypothetical protein n=1 Tax=Sphingomonas sp. PP-F2F-A104-K0414 TaxID=2135661 RepID=UPI00104D16C1|nr:hypothetical protein [Sphingomonas sp. PP-F2F-A104-K0414]TCP95148.1 hypothetical protein C8J46_1164 [Sphingomonas sp. PP-F2F-A104-K0414]